MRGSGEGALETKTNLIARPLSGHTLSEPANRVIVETVEGPPCKRGYAKRCGREIRKIQKRLGPCVNNPNVRLEAKNLSGAKPSPPVSASELLSSWTPSPSSPQINSTRQPPLPPPAPSKPKWDLKYDNPSLMHCRQSEVLGEILPGWVRANSPGHLLTGSKKRPRKGFQPGDGRGGT